MTIKPPLTAEAPPTAEDNLVLQGIMARLPALTLYHYVGVKGDRIEWLEPLLVHGKLFMRPYAKLNDPFDGTTVPFVFNGDPDDIRRYWTQHLADRGLPLDEV